MNGTTDTTSRRQSHADVRTDNASRYLQQLCKHFAHKLEVAFDEKAGSVRFSIGHCRLEAGDRSLQLSLDAPEAAALAELQEVVERHLIRFAFREELSIEWQ